jgi:hypothetical protein
MRGAAITSAALLKYSGLRGECTMGRRSFNLNLNDVKELSKLREVPPMLGALLSQSLSPEQAMLILIVGFAATAGVLIAVTAIVTSAVRSVAVTRLEIAMKRELVERGMSAEDIARVIDAHTCSGENVVNLPCASEAVVLRDDEWQPALVLQIGNGRYLVHHVGSDMDENEWVGEDRIRFRAGSQIPTLVSQSVANGVPRKEPMEAEV